MRRKTTLLIGIGLVTGICSCSSPVGKRTPLPPAIEVNHFDTLKQWMTGSFSNALQAENDSDYYDICLEMHPVWSVAEKESWIYVEQSLASMTDKPYRQRVYHLFQEKDSAFVSEVYEMKDPERFVGQWENDTIWNSLTPDSVMRKEGCAVYLQLQGNGMFEGSTDSATCLSTLRGAAFANSIVTVTGQGITSWDQGFDSTGVQVWGAEKGGYHFVKSKN